MMGYGNDFLYGRHWALGGIWMILWWILIIFALIFFVKWLLRQSHSADKSGPGSSALRILEERYAKGEIDKREFDRKKKELT